MNDKQQKKDDNNKFVIYFNYIVNFVQSGGLLDILYNTALSKIDG